MFKYLTLAITALILTTASTTLANPEISSTTNTFCLRYRSKADPLYGNKLYGPYRLKDGIEVGNKNNLFTVTAITTNSIDRNRFRLKSNKTGKTYGPFFYGDRKKIKLGAETYTLFIKDLEKRLEFERIRKITLQKQGKSTDIEEQDLQAEEEKAQQELQKEQEIARQEIQKRKEIKRQHKLSLSKNLREKEKRAWDKASVIGVDLYRGQIPRDLSITLARSGSRTVMINKPVSAGLLTKLDIYIVIAKGPKTKSYSEEEIASLKYFIEAGGGLLCSGNASSWTEQENGNKPVETFPLNVLGREMGFLISGKNIEAPAQAVTAIMKDAKDLSCDGWLPSEVYTRGPNARKLVIDANSKVMAGASTYKKGRIVALGHEKLLIGNRSAISGILKYLKGEISLDDEEGKYSDEETKLISNVFTNLKPVEKAESPPKSP